LMKSKVAKQIEILRRDFTRVVGRPFHHFFCPILFVDEETELCQAHVINQAFPSSSHKWTVQRKDVDSFYGSVFESALANLQYNAPGIAAKALINPDLHKRLRPKMYLNGKEVEHFVARGPIPEKFPELRLENDTGSVRFGLKMAADPSMFGENTTWQVEVFQDARVPAIVSAMKAAHLTMFTQHGYSYALRPGGYWLGQLLGSFYLQNKGAARDKVIQNAINHFGPFGAMVRPVINAPPAITGTVDDRWLHICWPDDVKDGAPWGLMVYIRTGHLLNAVILPTLENQADVDRFSQFLYSQGASFEVSYARYEETHWKVMKKRQRVEWPAANLTST